MTSTLPQLGFIHEDSANAFASTSPTSIETVSPAPQPSGPPASAQRATGRAGHTSSPVRALREQKVIATMIDVIKELLDGDDGRHHA